MRVPVYYYTYYDYLGVPDSELYTWVIMPSFCTQPYFDWLREQNIDIFLQHTGYAELGRTDLIVLAELTDAQATYFALRWADAVNQPDRGT